MPEDPMNVSGTLEENLPMALIAAAFVFVNLCLPALVIGAILYSIYGG